MRNEAVYDAIAELRRTGRPGVLATVVSIKGSSPGALGSKMLVTPDGRTWGTVGGGCVDGHVYAEMEAVLREERPRTFTIDLTDKDDPEHGLICGGRVEVFLEPIQTTHLVICGSGHIGHALARLAGPLDFKLTVIDDRERFLNEERFPAATRLCGPFSEILAETRAPHGAFIVVVTRGHRYDQECLEWALRQEEARYVGLIGSHVKIRKLLLRLRDELGFPADRLARVRAPVGLDIGAVTVEEIAVSIAAELVAVRRRGEVSRDLREPGRVDPKKARRPPATELPPPRGARTPAAGEPAKPEVTA